MRRGFCAASSAVVFRVIDGGSTIDDWTSRSAGSIGEGTPSLEGSSRRGIVGHRPRRGTEREPGAAERHEGEHEGEPRLEAALGHDGRLLARAQHRRTR